MKTFVNLNFFYINPQSINYQQKIKKNIWKASIANRIKLMNYVACYAIYRYK